LVGGKDATTGLPSHDIWYSALGGGWDPIATPDFAVGEALAATYSYADERLWVLDHAPDASGKEQVRLTRIDPVRRVAETVAMWERQRSGDRYWLDVDGDGGLLLTITSEVSNRSKIVRIDAQTLLVLIRGVTGALLEGPVVSDDGYDFAFRRRDGSIRIRHRRRFVGRRIELNDLAVVF
jgi:hypothetical protein